MDTEHRAANIELRTSKWGRFPTPSLFGARCWALDVSHFHPAVLALHRPHQRSRGKLPLPQSFSLWLARYLLGRIFLHLAALAWSRRNLRWHLRGIARELRLQL